MILLFSSFADTSAMVFARTWAARGVKLVTCKDLSRAGWKLKLPVDRAANPEDARTCLQAVVEGKRVAADQIDGVITRLPYVSEFELSHIHGDDRAYVAAEMHAFLFAFLSALRRPVVNRPSPACLLGPNWRWIQWCQQALRLGIQVVESDSPVCSASGRKRGTGDGGENSKGFVEVVVAGDRAFGEASTQLLLHAVRLATAAKTELLRAWFTNADSHAKLAACDLWPDLNSDIVGRHLLEHMERRVVC